jgi:hypothetical protein
MKMMKVYIISIFIYILLIVEVDALQFLKEQYLKKKQQEKMQSSPSSLDLRKDTSKLQQLIQYFQLNPSDDQILKDFVCSLEKNMVLYPGIMAISKKHLCFFSKFAGTHAVFLIFNSLILFIIIFRLNWILMKFKELIVKNPFSLPTLLNSL